VSAGAPSVPGEWTRELLQDHVGEIVFNGVERMELDCVLCQQAALAGLWDHWYDPDEDDSDWLAELRARAEAGAAPTHVSADASVASGRDEGGFVAATVVALVMSLLLVAGLVYDGGLTLAAHREAFNEAAAAARAGAQAMRTTTLAGGAVSADPAVATAAAQRYLAAVGHSGSVTVQGDLVAVSVSFPYRTVILGVAGLNDITVTGTGSARAERGVTTNEAP
jgi:hypothetical protein